MAGRIRTVKPEWLEDDIAVENSDVRVTSIGLILLADDHGRGRANDVILGAAIFPASPAKIRGSLARLRDRGYVEVYEVRGQRYFRITQWERHQRVDRPGKPRVPCPCEEFHTFAECPAKDRGTHAAPTRILATDHDHDHDHDQRPRPYTSSVAPTTDVEKVRDQPQVVIDYLNERTGRVGRSKYACKGKTRELIRSRLASHSTRELRLVVWYKSREWKGTEFEKYLRPSTLFMRSKFDDYLADAEQAFAQSAKKKERWEPAPILAEVRDASR